MRMLAKKGFIASAAAVMWYASSTVACYAEGEEGFIPGTGSTSGSVYVMLGKVVLFLVIIIVIFLGIMKLVSKKNQAFQSGRSIKSMGGLGLGQNKSVQLVQIGHSLYVLGVGNDVGLVAKIDDPEEIQFIIDHLHTSSAGEFKGLPTFGEWIRRLRGGKASSAEDLDVTPNFQAVFQERIQRMANRQRQMDELMSQDDDNTNERLNDKS